jgi:hypothetical protein
MSIVAMKVFSSSGIGDVGTCALTPAEAQIGAQSQVLVDDPRQGEYRAALACQAPDLGPAMSLT